VIGDSKATYMALGTNGLGTISDAKFGADHKCDLWAKILPFN